MGCKRILWILSSLQLLLLQVLRLCNSKHNKNRNGILKFNFEILKHFVTYTHTQSQNHLRGSVAIVCILWDELLEPGLLSSWVATPFQQVMCGSQTGHLKTRISTFRALWTYLYPWENPITPPWTYNARSPQNSPLNTTNTTGNGSF